MAPRAWKGFLVGLEGLHGHIFKVWLPDQELIVRARDDRFHETSGAVQSQRTDDVEFEAELVDNPHFGTIITTTLSKTTKEQETAREMTPSADKTDDLSTAMERAALSPTPTPEDQLLQEAHISPAEELPLPTVTPSWSPATPSSRPRSNTAFRDNEPVRPAPQAPRRSSRQTARPDYRELQTGRLTKRSDESDTNLFTRYHETDNFEAETLPD
ncbi:hypothetical protein JDV02_003108 [Purpureocillium takamizusanense]|uniref:Uncharacterized protein n=1 Tax=Purpureocillium takamizusanense TaxID=2060973 RepID=A0A9Q8QCZ5_9HYPO|nr:uncharacterized protein JDV02_003108 [Purpureocillium takamizusanense]UNI16694.1 hypothetical protein JDV02_003108 [Purpureocillium takamizusanense]